MYGLTISGMGELGESGTVKGANVLPRHFGPIEDAFLVHFLIWMRNFVEG